MHVSNRWSDERQRCGAVPMKTERIFRVSRRQCNIYKAGRENWFPVWVWQSGSQRATWRRWSSVYGENFRCWWNFPPGLSAVRLNWQARANNKIIKKFQNLFPGEIFTLELCLCVWPRWSRVWKITGCTEHVVFVWIWEDLRSIYEVRRVSLLMKFLCGFKAVLSWKLRAKMEEELIPRLLMLCHSVISEIIANEWMLLASGKYILTNLSCIFDYSFLHNYFALQHLLLTIEWHTSQKINRQDRRLNLSLDFICIFLENPDYTLHRKCQSHLEEGPDFYSKFHVFS